MQGMQGMDHGQMNMSQERPGQFLAKWPCTRISTGPHMHMTAKRPASAEDWTKADEIANTLRDAIEKYKDYHVACRMASVFMPNVPQPMYHFNEQ